eukprot:1731818-Alexandrium_andersonii.AAC.1
MLEVARETALEDAHPQVRWMLADSSPQQSHDWFWCKYFRMPVAELVGSFAGVLRLAEYVSSLGPEGLESAVFEPPQWVREDMLRLARVHRSHICIPTAVTSGMRDVPHKSSAMVHALAMEATHP